MGQELDFIDEVGHRSASATPAACRAGKAARRVPGACGIKPRCPGRSP
jgi:hypothetical protein